MGHGIYPCKPRSHNNLLLLQRNITSRVKFYWPTFFSSVQVLESRVRAIAKRWIASPIRNNMMLTFNRLTGICHMYSCIGRGFAGTPATAFPLWSRPCSLSKPSVWLPILCRRMLCCVDVVMEMSAIIRLLYQTARVVQGALGIDVQENASATTLLVSADCGIVKYFDR